jgi:serine/alanine adding enzyme
MDVELVQDSDRWDAYVNASAPERLYHQWVWREVIEETFGHAPYYLAAVEEGCFRGVLPLFFIQSWLFGNSLVSLPFFSYGGILADTAAAREALLSHAATIAEEAGAGHVELRQGDQCEMPWAESSSKVVMEVSLPGSVEEYFDSLSASRRKRLRYILKNQFQVEWGGVELLPSFYRVFAINMRNLGTVVKPWPRRS